MKNRRQFFKTLFGVVAAGVTVLRGEVTFAKKLGLKIEKVPSLAKVGGSATVKLNGKEVLLVRVSDSEVKGMSPKCTHQNCPLKYNAKTRKLDCSCHGSSFELDGKVLKGPATKNITTYATSFKEGRIVITVD